MSERIRRARRPEPRASGGIPAWAVVLAVLAVVGLGGLAVMQTGDKPREQPPRERPAERPRPAAKPQDGPRKAIRAEAARRVAKNVQFVRQAGGQVSDAEIATAIANAEIEVEGEFKVIAHASEVARRMGASEAQVLEVAREVEEDVRGLGTRASSMYVGDAAFEAHAREIMGRSATDARVKRIADDE